jgi:hypothetical protein
MNVEQLMDQRTCAARLMELRRQRDVVEMWLASAAPADCKTQLEDLLLSVDAQLGETEAEMSRE